MEANLVTRDGIHNLNEENKFIYYPVILNAKFEKLGRFNIVVSNPEGLGMAFFTGWAKPGKFERSWTLPIQHTMGEWDIVIVLNPKDGLVDHVSLKGILTEETVTYDPSLLIKEETDDSTETIAPMEIKFPNKDVTIPYPSLWISGTGYSPFELEILERNYNIIPNANNEFLLPIKIKYGEYSVLDISGGKGTSGFRSSFSIFAIKGTLDSPIEVNLPIIGSTTFEIYKSVDSDPEEVKTPSNAGVLYGWEQPVDNHCSIKKFQHIKGWAELGAEIIIDGNVIPVMAKDDNESFSIGTFEYLHPIRFGINELEIKITNKEGKVARESRFIECDISKFSFSPIKKEKKIETGQDAYILSAQISPSHETTINGENVEVDEDGFFMHPLKLTKNGLNTFNLEAKKVKTNQDEYPLMRNGSQVISELRYVTKAQLKFLEDQNIQTINDFFNLDLYESNFESEYELIFQLQKFLGFLLIGNSELNLGLFSELEAFLISKTDIKSIEDFIQFDPQDLLNELNDLLKNLQIDKEFTIGDANRWQRTLDDLLLEYQEEYLS